MRESATDGEETNNEFNIEIVEKKIFQENTFHSDRKYRCILTITIFLLLLLFGAKY